MQDSCFFNNDYIELCIRIKTLFIVENFIVIIKSGIIRDNWQI